MDIQVSSNFERLLFESSDRDSDYIRQSMSSLGQSGSFSLGDKVWNEIKADFSAERADNEAVDQTIKSVLADSGYLLDPHTAVGVSVARRMSNSSAPMVVLATAHPATFPDAVESACGTRPGLPERNKSLMDGEEHFTLMPNDLDVVEDYISKNTRAIN